MFIHVEIYRVKAQSTKLILLKGTKILMSNSLFILTQGHYSRTFRAEKEMLSLFQDS